MKINGITFKPIGYELGYCIGRKFFRNKIYYFKGYPDKPYEECDIIELSNADVKTFTSDTIMGEGKDKYNQYFQGNIVQKGKGQLLNQDWEFIPSKGLKCENIELFWGSNRKNNQDKLGNEEQFNYKRFDSEDSYSNFQKTETWFRLSYDSSDLLKEIEFLSGSMRIKSIQVIGNNTSTNDIINSLNNYGMSLTNSDYDGWLDKVNKISISSSIDMGGDTDECVYFYASNDISHWN